MGGMPSVGVFSKGSYPIFTRVSKKTTENSERLGRQARPGIELGTYRLLVLERRITQPLVGTRTDNLTFMPYPGFRPGIFGALMLISMFIVIMTLK